MTQAEQGAGKKKRPVAMVCYLSRHLALIWAICLVGVVVLSLVPKAAPSPNVDKIVHVSTFAFLAILSILTFRRTRSVALSLFCVLGVGLVSEAAQSFVPGRSASLSDLGADLAGVVLGVLVGLPIVALIRRRRRLRNVIRKSPVNKNPI